MSKDDFRDRLKSYSLEPEQSDWAKMQQLLDADEDDRKGFAWWKFGALFALLLIPTSIYLMGGSYGAQGLNQSSVINFSSNNTPQSSVKNETTASSNVEIVKAQANNSSANNNQASATNTVKENIDEVSNDEQTNKKASSPSSFKNTNSNNRNNNNSINHNSKNKTATKTKGFISKENLSKITISRPRAFNSSQLKTSKLPNADDGHDTDYKVIERIGDLTIGSENALIAEVTAIEGLSTSSFGLENRELPTLDYAPYTKVYPKVKNNPWYLVTSVGAKYPIVDVSNAGLGTGGLVPTQKLFPSYLAEAGIGKHFGKLSFEGGVTGSLYQYKLGQANSAAVEDLQWGTQHNGTQYEITSFSDFDSGRVVSSEDQNFIINKFAVFSPYLRGQYSFDLKRKFVLGLHALFSINRKVNIQNQQISTAASFEPEPQGDFSEAIQDVINGKNTNLNYELGFSIEKLFEKRGRIALDFSYGFATGLLEAGAYSVSRESNNVFQDSFNGSYTINGAGPKVKFRYYLNTKG